MPDEPPPFNIDRPGPAPLPLPQTQTRVQAYPPGAPISSGASPAMPTTIPNEYLEDRGNYRLERRFKQEQEGGYLWTVYEKIETGATADNPTPHPVIKDDKGD